MLDSVSVLQPGRHSDCPDGPHEPTRAEGIGAGPSRFGSGANCFGEAMRCAESSLGVPFIGLLSFLISGFLWGVAIHAVRTLVDREVSHSFSTSVYLGFGIKVAAALIVLLLGGLLGPLALAPVLFVAWGILARYGKLSEKQAALAVVALVALDFVWVATGLS